MKRSLIAAAVFLLACYQLNARPAQLSEGSHDAQSVEAHLDIAELGLNPARSAELGSALARKDYKHAEAILVEEAERQPNSPQTAKLLDFAGGIFFLDAQYLNSAIAWKRADAISSLSARSRFTLAMAYVKLERQQWARAELETLGRSQPNNALYLYWLARLDYDAQKYTEAIAELQRVLKIDPKMTRAYDLLGLCYDYLGRLEDAISNFAVAVDLNRSQPTPSPWPPLDMAISQIELGQLPEAEANLRKAIEYQPRLPQANYQLGLVLDKQGKIEEAIEVLKRCANLDPSYPEPHYLLGRIYHALEKTELARIEVERFQELKKRKDRPSEITSGHPQ